MRNKITSTVYGREEKFNNSSNFGSLSYTNITTMTAMGNSVTITCSGVRPVLVQLVNETAIVGPTFGSGKDAGFAQSSGMFIGDWLYQDGTAKIPIKIDQTFSFNGGACAWFSAPHLMSFTIFPTAGSHTYQIRGTTNSNGGVGLWTNYFYYVRLAAFEL